MPTPSPSYQLADHLLPGGVRDFVLSRRSVGKSWRRITMDMYDVTNRVVDVTHETLRTWFPEDVNGDEGAAA